MVTKFVSCHLHPAYLGLSETFIHRFLANLTNWQAIVLTEEIRNSSNYGFEEFYPVIEVESQRRLANRFYSKLVRAFRPDTGDYFDLHACYSKALRRTKPMLLHAHFGTTGWFALPLARLHHLPLIVSFHGVDASALLRDDIWLSRYAQVFNAAACVTVPSQHIQQNLLKVGCPPDKLHVVRNGLNLEDWAFHTRYDGDKTESFNVLMVSRLVEKKGVLYALRAIELVRQQLPWIHLRIAGDGELKSLIQREISERGLAGQVSLLGFRPNTEVLRLMNESDLLLVPSVTAANGDEEGLPTVLIEAAALGLPIVATDHAGAPELIRDGESGFLVPERDEQALAERILTMARRPELRCRFASAARTIVEQEYDLSRAVAQLEAIYDSTMVTA